MRVAYICADPGVPVFGRKGCSIHVQEVIRALLRQGAEVELFATRFDGVAPDDLAAVQIHQLPKLPKGEPAQRETAALAANLDLFTTLDRAGPFDLVYERYSLWSYSGMQYAEQCGVPGLLEVNAPLIEEQAAHRSLHNRSAAEQIALRAFQTASALLAVSEQVGAYLERYRTPDAVHVVPNGVNIERFAAAPQPTAAFTVGFVGTMKPWHGLPVLVDAFAQLHTRVAEARLLIVGDGTERERIEADVAQRGLSEAVHFTGAVDPSAVPALLSAMDVAVAPYPQQEVFYFSPLKVYEYMAAGLPVVASRIGQLDDVIDHGRTGLLCSPGDMRALADALALLHSNPQLRAALGQSARAEMQRDHSWESVAQRILDIAASSAPVRSNPDLALAL